MRFSADGEDPADDCFPVSPSGRALRHVQRVDYSKSGLTAAGMASPRRKRSTRTQTPERVSTFASSSARAYPAEDAPPVTPLSLVYPADDAPPVTPLPSVPLSLATGGPSQLDYSRDHEGGPQTREGRRVSFNESVLVKYLTPESRQWADDEEVNEQQQQNRRADRGLWAEAGQLFRGRLKSAGSGSTGNTIFQGSDEGASSESTGESSRRQKDELLERQRSVAERPSARLRRFRDALRALDILLGCAVRNAALALALFVRFFFRLLFSEDEGLFTAPRTRTRERVLPFSRKRKSSRFSSIVTYNFLVGLLCWLLVVKILFTRRPLHRNEPNDYSGDAVPRVPFSVAGTREVKRDTQMIYNYHESTWEERAWFHSEPGEPIAVIQLNDKNVPITDSEVGDEHAVSLGTASTAADHHPAATETTDEDVAGRAALPNAASGLETAATAEHQPPASQTTDVGEDSRVTVGLGTAPTATHRTPASQTADVGGDGTVAVLEEEHAISVGTASTAPHQLAATETTDGDVAGRAALLDGDNAGSLGTAPTAEHQPPASETTVVDEACQVFMLGSEDEPQKRDVNGPLITGHPVVQTLETRVDHASIESGAVPVMALSSPMVDRDQTVETRIDHASLKSGAVPVMPLTSPTADRSRKNRYFWWLSPDTRRYLRRKLWNFLGAPADLSRHPVWALSGQPLSENCWVMAGDSGHLTLRLGGKIRPRELVLHQPHFDPTAAPRDVEILGVSVTSASSNEQIEEYFSLGRIRYDASAPGPQRYNLEHTKSASGGDEDEEFDMIQIRISSNHGNRRQTHLCKFSLYD